MVDVDADAAAEYRAAREAWQRQVGRLEGVLLDGAAMGAPQLKGLLNREARAKERYDVARLRLLGMSGSVTQHPRLGSPVELPVDLPQCGEH